MEERFSEIYRLNLWDSKESDSGIGSEEFYTRTLREWLVGVIGEYEIRTVVDAGCGDFNWMRLVVQNVDINYFGFDIVESVIDSNIQNFSSEKNHFSVANICRDDLPNCDLLIVRDCLFHLSFADVNDFLKNIAKVDYKFILTTTHLVDHDFKNSDITSGDFRHIDLFGDPFGFNQMHIVECLDDYPEGHPEPRQMLLVKKTDVPVALGSIGNDFE
jgi:hypothetical protein